MKTRNLCLLTIATLVLCSATLLAERPLEQGIQVHGHWKIEVFEADGSPVSTHEFENALVAAGGVRLSEILGRSKTQGLWGILLNSVSGPDRPCTSSGLLNHCLIVEPLDTTLPEGGTSKNLNLTVASGQLVLAGSVVVNSTAASPVIEQVSVRAGSCANTVPASECIGGPFGPGDTAFTFTTITSIPVTAGQLVQATVTLSFS